MSDNQQSRPAPQSNPARGSWRLDESGGSVQVHGNPSAPQGERVVDQLRRQR